MNIQQLYLDYGVPVAPENHKHFRDGWVNVECPYCTGHTGFHLGWNVDGGFFVCWRCGSHPVFPTFSLVLGVRKSEVGNILKKYNSRQKTHLKTARVYCNTLKLPPGVTDLSKNHKKYLESRGYDPEQLEREWDLKSTGMVSRLKEIDYKNRILIPFYWDGQMVTFQARAPYDRNPEEFPNFKKYLAAPESIEVRNIKEMLYGKQERWSDLAFLVEGVTGVWRIGFQAVSCLGIKYKPAQIRLLHQHFKRVVILFDPETQAQEQAEKIRKQLLFMGTDAHRCEFPGADPGEMTPAQAADFVKDWQTWRVR